MNALFTADALEQLRLHQYRAFQEDPVPSAKERVADLVKLKLIISENQPELCQALEADFGCRSECESALLELFSVLESINHAIKHVKSWMNHQRRHTSIWFQPARNRVIPQPVGVVGIIVPWNFPLFCGIGPMVAAIAAGNRVMVKMSDNSKNITKLLQKLFTDVFSDDQICIIAEERNSDTGKLFSQLAFDHLIFTGSTKTGKSIMAAAAVNLVPVTLELGGKSPVILDSGCDISLAISRILGGKVYNSGQTCVAPDYLLIPYGMEAEIREQAMEVMAQRFTDINHADYTSVIDNASFNRLTNALHNAAQFGAEVVNLIPNSEPDSSTRKFPLHLIFGPTDDMTVMQDEIFGPILPVMTYNNLQEAIDYINSRERPLALYLFSNDSKIQQQVINQTRSGGVGINDVIFQVCQEDLPFGGIGQSGMGNYHGRHGFEALSKLRPVMYQSRLATSKYLYAPYSSIGKKLINFVINHKLTPYGHKDVRDEEEDIKMVDE